MPNQIVIYELSHVGLMTARFLRRSGVPVLVAGCPRDRTALDELEEMGIPVVCADTGDFRLMSTLDLASARSVILSSDNEQFNLQAALHAVEINPELRIVIRLFNLNLARKLEESVRNFRVLSVSQVSSPSFTASSLLAGNILSFEAHKTILSLFEAGGEIFAGRTVGDVEAREEVKVVSRNHSLFPGEGETIGTKDRLVLFGRCAQARTTAGIRISPRRTPRSGNGWSLRKWAAAARRLDRFLTATLGALLLIGLLGVVTIHFEERLDLFNSFYVVIAMLTSGGFEDMAFRDYHLVTKLTVLGLMASGVTLVAFLFAVVSDRVLKKRLDFILGRRKQNLRDHVILCGAGDVGVRVLEDLLLLGEKVIVIEKDQEGRFVSSVTQRSVPLVIADATLEESLLNANIAGAKAIICATDSDLRNLEIGLNARSLSPGIRVVLRVFDGEFAEKVQRHFDIHTALSSSAIAAPAFASAATDLGIINIVEIGGVPLKLKEEAARARDERSPGDERGVKQLATVRRGGEVRFDVSESVQKGDRRIFFERA